MFRLASPAALSVVAASAGSTTVVSTRGFATLKDISMRLKSITNIQKITKSMKMVAAAKYARAERELKAAKPYGDGSKAFYDSVDLEEDEQKADHLMLVMTSDRGLCGAVHSNIGRSVKRDMAERLHQEAGGKDVKIICVGDKAKQILQRVYPNQMLFSVNEFGRQPPTFADATYLAQAILESGYDFKQGDIYFNRFKTVVSYETLRCPIYSREKVTSANKIGLYDSLDDDVVQCYLEYSLASLIYYCMKESACAEQSSRMTAMDSASKNAGEMIDKLTLLFNRTRQAVITRELIEIISGAESL